MGFAVAFEQRNHHEPLQELDRSSEHPLLTSSRVPFFAPVSAQFTHSDMQGFYQ